MCFVYHLFMERWCICYVLYHACACIFKMLYLNAVILLARDAHTTLVKKTLIPAKKAIIKGMLCIIITNVYILPTCFYIRFCSTSEIQYKVGVHVNPPTHADHLIRSLGTQWVFEISGMRSISVTYTCKCCVSGEHSCVCNIVLDVRSAGRCTCEAPSTIFNLCSVFSRGWFAAYQMPS